MKKRILLSVMSLGLIAGVGCSPTASQLKKTIEANPDVVFAAIEKNPTLFFETVQKAQRQAQESGQADRIQSEVKRVLEEAKTPKQPEIDPARVIGNVDAPITIVEYSDYNCGHCGTAHQTVKALQAKYGDKVRFVFKNFPVLDGRTKTSALAAEYTEAGMLQSKEIGYKIHSGIFENQGQLMEKGEAFLKEVAKEAGADLAKLQKDRKGAKVKAIVKADMEEAMKFGFEGTPGFLINGATLPGAYPEAAFVQIIDALLAAPQS